MVDEVGLDDAAEAGRREYLDSVEAVLVEED